MLSKPVNRLVLSGPQTPNISSGPEASIPWRMRQRRHSHDFTLRIGAANTDLHRADRRRRRDRAVPPTGKANAGAPAGTCPIRSRANFPTRLSVCFRFDGFSWMDDLSQAGFDVLSLDFLGYGDSDRYPLPLIGRRRQSLVARPARFPKSKRPRMSSPGQVALGKSRLSPLPGETCRRAPFVVSIPRTWTGSRCSAPSPFGKAPLRQKQRRRSASLRCPSSMRGLPRRSDGPAAGFGQSAISLIE